MWAWLLKNVGGFGLLSTVVINVPLTTILLVQRRWGMAALMCAVCLFMSVAMGRQERKRDQARAARRSAIAVVRNLQEHGKGLRDATREELDIIARGLDALE